MPFLMQVMGVDREVGNPCLNAMVENVRDERPVLKRNQRLWEGVGERFESSSKSGTEKESFPHGRNVGLFACD